jgi:hypothetical protein
MKTSELTGSALDWAVAKAAGYLSQEGNQWMVKLPYVSARMNFVPGPRCVFTPSTRWAQGGPIIEQEKITVVFRVMRDGSTNYWATTEPNDLCTDYEPVGLDGPTPLIAAMRCYVASHLGDEVSIPEELVCEPSK